jgi:hypothetical protein
MISATPPLCDGNGKPSFNDQKLAIASSMIAIKADDVWNSTDAKKVEESLNWLFSGSKCSGEAKKALFNIVQTHHDQSIRDKTLRFLKNAYGNNPEVVKLAAKAAADAAWNTADPKKINEGLQYLFAEAKKGNEAVKRELRNIARNHPQNEIKMKVLDFMGKNKIPLTLSEAGTAFYGLLSNCNLTRALALGTCSVQNALDNALGQYHTKLLMARERLVMNTMLSALGIEEEK